MIKWIRKLFGKKKYVIEWKSMRLPYDEYFGSPHTTTLKARRVDDAVRDFVCTHFILDPDILSITETSG